MNVETPVMIICLYFLIFGAILGLIYEVLKILRILIPHHTFFVGVEDTLYFTLSAVALFGVSMELGNGQLRVMYIISAIIGVILYYFTIGVIIRFVYERIIKALKKLLALLNKKILKPVLKLFVRIALKSAKPFVKTHKNLSLSFRNSLKHLKHKSNIVYNNDNAHLKGVESVVVKARIKAKIKK